MAKDPAMLWYWSDWYSGTSTLSRFLKGCYMDLLHAQFNNGPLSLEEIKTVLGSDFGTSWPALQKKFTQTNGLFFNERLESEKEKRKKFVRSRSENKKGKLKSHDKSYVNHMTGHMENVNEDVNKNVISKGGVGENEIESNFEVLESNQIWINGCLKAYSLSRDQFNEALSAFKAKCIVACEDQSISGLMRYFSNWFPINKERIFKTGKHEQREQNTNDLKALNEAATAHLAGNH